MWESAPAAVTRVQVCVVLCEASPCHAHMQPLGTCVWGLFMGSRCEGWALVLQSGGIPSRDIEKSLNQDFLRSSILAKHQEIPLPKHQEVLSVPRHQFHLSRNPLVFGLFSMTQFLYCQLTGSAQGTRALEWKEQTRLSLLCVCPSVAGQMK